MPGEIEEEEEMASLRVRATAQLTGAMSDSPHLVINETGGSSMRYFRFQGLTISSPGNYVLRIALCQMSGPSRPSLQEATTAECVDSRVVHVCPHAPRWPLGTSSSFQWYFLTR